MIAFGELSVTASALLLVAAAVVITVAGVKMSATADRLADVTGLGEAITGAVFLGATTSFSGIITSVTAASDGHPQLAISNAVGGIAAQTFFLTVADLAYRRANLEHAAASLANLMNGCLLMALLALPLLAHAGPPFAIFGLHPVTPVLPIAYALGVVLASRANQDPMWGPKETTETKQDTPEEPVGDGRHLLKLLTMFLLLAVTVGVAGFVVGKTGITLSQKAGLSEGLVGTLFTAVATSMPELVTTVASVRRGALTLAVGGILGGNAFDVLFVAFSDVAYRQGSIYHAITGDQVFILVLSLLMTAVLLLGLLHRERYGLANIGFESVLCFLLYFGGVSVLIFG